MVFVALDKDSLKTIFKKKAVVTHHMYYYKQLVLGIIILKTITCKVIVVNKCCFDILRFFKLLLKGCGHRILSHRNVIQFQHWKMFQELQKEQQKAIVFDIISSLKDISLSPVTMLKRLI